MYRRLKASDGGYVEVSCIDGKVVIEVDLDDPQDDCGPQLVFMTKAEVHRLISFLQESLSNVDA